MKRSIITLFFFLIASLPTIAQETSDPNAQVKECENQGCFAIKFKSCDPAKFTVVTRMGTAQYEILGEKESGCSVRLIYLDNPNPDWENKPLICTYDNSLEFKKAAKRALLSAMMGTGADCEGDLLKLLQETQERQGVIFLMRKLPIDHKTKSGITFNTL